MAEYPDLTGEGTDVSGERIILPTADDLAMAGMSIGDAAKGEMVVGDGDTECAGCNAKIDRGSPLYWRCSSAMECDPYCASCAIEDADRTRAICAAIEDGELMP